MFCKNCGTQLPDGMKFCTICGTPVAPAETVAPQEAEDFISLTQSFDADQIAEPPAEDLLDVATQANGDYLGYENPAPAESFYAPVQPQAPVYQAQFSNNQPVYQQPVAPMPQFEPPKKKNTGFIVGITIGLVGIFVLVFCILAFVAPGFLLDKNKGSNTNEDDANTASVVSESTTKKGDETDDPEPEPDEPDEPVVSVELEGAEDLAWYYLYSVTQLDVVSVCDCEAIGWSMYEDAFNAILLETVEKEAGVTLTEDEMYEMLSEGLGESITCAEDYLELVISQQELPDAEIEIKSSKEISKSEATPYINKTKNNIDDYIDYGLDSSDIYWEQVESYALVEGTSTTSDGVEKITLVLGYVDEEWYILHADDNGSTYLASLSLLEGMVE